MACPSRNVGRVAENNIGVAHAVATSAAYLVLLPAVDRIHTFIDRDENRIKQRVVLTDGGIFHNLVVTCMEPGRSAEISCNVFQPEYIVCSDAGAGLFSDHVYPYWWSGRMVRSFEAFFRKTLNAAYERLHRHVASGALKGFALAYLGQQDQRLPYIPPDLVRRDEVFNYPTDFFPMRFEDIERISARGEQLMRLLIAQYCQKL